MLLVGQVINTLSADQPHDQCTHHRLTHHCVPTTHCDRLECSNSEQDKPHMQLVCTQLCEYTLAQLVHTQPRGGHSWHTPEPAGNVTKPLTTACKTLRA